MWDSIKQILNKTNGTCIIVEDGRPSYVVINFDDYRRMLDLEGERSFEPSPKEGARESEHLEKINQDITDWKVRQSENSAGIHLSDIQDSDDELRIENLPLV